jgi:hypothetical protein
VSREEFLALPTLGRRTSMSNAVSVSGIVTEAEVPQPTPRISTLSARRESTTIVPAEAAPADATARTTVASAIRPIIGQRYSS